MKRFFVSIALLLLLVAPVKAASSTLSLVVLNPPDANQGEQVSFNVVTNHTDRPWVGVRCNQNGAFVLDGYVGVFPGSLQPDITLDSAYWTAGVPASCTARLIDWDTGRQHILDILTFSVLP